MDSYCVVVNGYEVYVNFSGIGVPLMAAEEAIKKLGWANCKLMVHQIDPQSIEAKVYKINMVEGKTERKFIGSVFITLPHANFTKEMENILSGIPKEFHSFVRNYVDGQFNHFGYTEILDYAKELVFQLEPAILEYTINLKKG